MDGSETLLCAALRGVPGGWRELRDPAAASRFLAAAAQHRLRPLLAWRLHQSPEWTDWPDDIRRGLVNAERAEAALEIVRHQDLSVLLRAFDRAGVPLLLFKGAALAYSRYPRPWLRPREDTDILVRPADRRRAEDLIAAAGYRPVPAQSGTLVAHQRLYVRADAAGRRQSLDLHWKIANPAPFADLLDPGALLDAADTIAFGDGPAARIPCRVHALVLACWHRVSHHHDSDDLLWIYDVHLLADALAPAESAALRAIVRDSGTTAICARGLALAAERFGTRLEPDLLMGEITAPPGRAAGAAAYLRADARKVDLLAADLRALPDWRSRARLLREHLLPPPEYMRAAHRSRRGWLPALYVWRIARGARAWFRRPRR